MSIASALTGKLGRIGADSSLRGHRVEAARRVSAWTEVEETDLVRRPPACFVHAECDELFTAYRGVIFTAGQTRPSFNEQVAMVFYVDGDGELVFLEHANPRTWSEVVARRARR